MGVERAVTRWYAQRQAVQREIDALQAQLAQLPEQNQPAQARAELERQLTLVQARLNALGPCPRPMMG